MAGPDETCWTMIEDAARGVHAEREEFARRYSTILLAYLRSRWPVGSRHAQDVEDACQEILVECFRDEGALSRVERDRPGGFRAYLYGTARNVARRFEQRGIDNREEAPSTQMPLDGNPVDEASLSVVFDRAWALNIVREAARLQARNARGDAAAARRVELLTLRFHEGLPIREIARRWDEDPAHLHHQYAQARIEFQRALDQVLAYHQPGDPARAAEEGDFLMDLLG